LVGQKNSGSQRLCGLFARFAGDIEAPRLLKNFSGIFRSMRTICVPQRSGRFRGAVIGSVAALMLAGCAGLPTSGPTGIAIKRGAVAKSGEFPFTLVEVNSPADIPSEAGLPVASLAEVKQPTDLLGPGDVLTITIYEAGVALFGNSALRPAGPAGTGFDPSSKAERLPAVRIDDSGYIQVPFVGRLRAAGRTTAELREMIEDGLRGMSQDPQVMVSIQESITNSVIVAGEVAKPGRLVLSTNRESLIDAIALAGGYRGAAKDAVARVQRGNDTFEVRLSDLLDMPQDDIQVAPGDRITLVSRPRSFSVLGAPNRTEEITFPRSPLSLVQAVALAGGANPNQGDAGAVFLFRYVQGPDGAQQPTVYHFNMMKPGAYLLAQQFQIEDRDLLYIGNARANQLTKSVQLLSQLFVPITTVTTIDAQRRN
jgi:polysaccharide export outer membrane protein